MVTKHQSHHKSYLSVDWLVLEQVLARWDHVH